MTRIAIASLLLLALAACGNEPSGKTTTKLDAVEVEPGTISDSMIILDDASGDGTAVDNSIPDDGTAKPAEKKDEEATEGSAESKTAGEGETISTPVAKKTETSAPAAKKAGE
ncbi:hypothetical protein BWQ93_04710 [Sphingopyxis sp. QXT-31]|uniref:hypothetical protein n=1 Tax=Sphingopyxis sp. QXT-31 TaxID=1357916 RepID=UPI0009796521|nr:hypothetical protein [Sphingopyxis sp. QXT-31]APZ97868.1 hypothetical protein BWQ93_04710 [Sphingopyxis sp. QXT-31]